MRALLCILALCFALPLAAQTADEATSADPQGTVPPSATAPGGSTLEDILARQRGEYVEPRGDSLLGDGSAQDMAGQLGTLGGASDSEIWRALRYGHDSVEVSAGGDVARVLMQDGGMRWYQFREGPLSTYGGYLLLGTLGALLLFYLLRGRIAVDEPMTGRTVLRFKFIERMAHWIMAGSFILLGFTGLFVKYGRDYILPLVGKDINAALLMGSKFIHNNVAWAFMAALALVFVMWVWHNIPNRTDITWFAQFGGIIGKNHPPAKKFNGGQKIIFWSCIVFGGIISVTGISLLFPYALPIGAPIFGMLNDIGVPGWFGLPPLPVELALQEEMQVAQMVHAVASFILMAIIIAHIYIGSVGMEGAYDAMGTGEVDEAWAHQHHSLWLDEIKEKERAAPKGSAATPAE